MLRSERYLVRAKESHGFYKEERLPGRRLGGSLAMKASSKAEGGDGGLDRADPRSSSKRARLYAKIERLFNRMEKRADKLEDKKSKNLATRGDRMALSLYKNSWIIAVVASMAAVPAVGAAGAFVLYSFQVFWLFVKMTFILMVPAGMFIGTGAQLAFPAILPSISSFLSVATLVTAMMLFFKPRSRSLLSLSLGSALPLLSGWVALIPTRTVEVIESVRVLDPLRPLLEEEFFRPLFQDLFINDFLTIVPHPFLIAGPVEVVVSSSTPSPLLPLKIALSLAAIGVAAYAWHAERHRLRGWLAPALSPSPAFPLPPSQRERLEPTAADEEEGEEGRLAALKAWEEEYQLRPPPSSDPAQWSQEELGAQLAKAGLQGCVEPLRRAKIDGRVALTLTWDDEEEMREELGLSKLGERRRLLLFVEDMRVAHERERAARLKSERADEKESGGGGGADGGAADGGGAGTAGA